ncbi:hypothetical protein NDU88_003375 [Pleurodeles waltl]|uniref:Uncharacterized protein n=1 Tax=Pleurodeles waltl TaxID=8319 RepID=A0AAV7WTG4_PLEWA|nr:hypothetical protein NDU88_003375 [Pleurodeles waltl]
MECADHRRCWHRPGSHNEEVTLDNKDRGGVLRPIDETLEVESSKDLEPVLKGDNRKGELGPHGGENQVKEEEHSKRTTTLLSVRADLNCCFD